MSTYAIGDVQGCYNELMQLLDIIKFNESDDELWFVGDLVNRGPQSLAVLRFIKNLNHKKIVLGNHDLHLLAVANGCREMKDNDALAEILAAPDRDELLSWLKDQPLLHYDKMKNTVMVHAGLPPAWTLAQAIDCAASVEAVLRSDDFKALLLNMYGNKPDSWQNDLTGWDRYRYIINALTRMRYCDAFGHLDFNAVGAPGSQPAHLAPWFDAPIRKKDKVDIIFGHWASLKGSTHQKNIIGLDTGCIWGGELTALRLDDHQLFDTKRG